MSIKTSRNILPSAFKWAVKKELLTSGMSVLDWGCGRFNKSLEFVKSLGCGTSYFGYDPNLNLLTADTLGFIKSNCRPYLDYDIVFLCNVMNVISSDLDRFDAFFGAWSRVKIGGVMIVQIYEGDKSGVVTKTCDGWQTNKRAADLLSEFDMPSNATIVKHGNIWALTKSN